MSDYKSDEWQNGERTLGDHVALVRKNVSLSGVRPADFPYELMVSLVYEDVQDDGLPGSTEESELLNQNEELIADHFCNRYGAKFGLCVTSDGVRDLFLYLAESLSDDEIQRELESCSPSVDYDCGIRHSPEWSLYDAALLESEDQPGDGKKTPWWKRMFGSR